MSREIKLARIERRADLRELTEDPQPVARMDREQMSFDDELAFTAGRLPCCPIADAHDFYDQTTALAAGNRSQRRGLRRGHSLRCFTSE